MANKNNHGGPREGSGRKPLVNELDRIKHIKNALRVFYEKDTDDKAIEAFITDALQSDKTQLWFLKQVLGEVATNLDVTSGGEKMVITLKN